MYRFIWGTLTVEVVGLERYYWWRLPGKETTCEKRSHSYLHNGQRILQCIQIPIYILLAKYKNRDRKMINYVQHVNQRNSYGVRRFIAILKFCVLKLYFQRLRSWQWQSKSHLGVGWGPWVAEWSCPFQQKHWMAWVCGSLSVKR